MYNPLHNISVTDRRTEFPYQMRPSICWRSSAEIGSVRRGLRPRPK